MCNALPAPSALLETLKKLRAYAYDSAPTALQRTLLLTTADLIQYALSHTDSHKRAELETTYAQLVKVTTVALPHGFLENQLQRFNTPHEYSLGTLIIRVNQNPRTDQKLGAMIPLLWFVLLVRQHADETAPLVHLFRTRVLHTHLKERGEEELVPWFHRYDELMARVSSEAVRRRKTCHACDQMIHCK